MAVIKNTSSGKSVMIIDERGFCYITSKKALQWLLNGGSSEPLLLTLLPTRVEGGRFKLSEIFVDGRKITLKEALVEGLVDSSFYESVVSKDFLASKGDSKGNVKGKVLKPVGDFKL